MDTRKVICLLKGDTTPFGVTVPAGEDLQFLKRIIAQDCKYSLRDVDVQAIVLWKVS